jgi:4-hydroxy-3-polyprenylbenzoate decarboxylase
MSAKKKVIVAVTGASGTIYGVRLVEHLAKGGHEIHLIVSEAGKEVARLEADLDPASIDLPGVTLLDEGHISAGVASGSFRTDGMVIAPCSMRTLTAVAAGQASNLIQRAADVTLKERRTLILVPRETPLNRLHIENMLRAHDAGAVIMPAMPAFYGKAGGIDELVDSFTGRVLDLLGIENDLAVRWQT